jgi:hypothetical protein
MSSKADFGSEYWVQRSNVNGSFSASTGPLIGPFRALSNRGEGGRYIGGPLTAAFV